MHARTGWLAIVGLTAIFFGSDSWAVCYVNQNATGKDNGTSWTDAYVHPQLALLSGCTEIWVAKGVYTPVLAGSDPTVSFDIPTDTKMYGGFAGGESSVDQRLPSINQTVLSGDVDHNDHDPGSWLARTASDINEANSYHIVTFDSETTSISSSTRLDGFIISAGKDDSDGYGGAAIICLGSADCAPTLTNLVLAGNESSSGGAVFIEASGEPTISNSLFVGNRSNSAGGALSIYGGLGKVLISNCAFINNVSAESGGAAFILKHTDFENVTFANNLTSNSDSSGGAIVIFSTVSALTNVTLVGNSSNGVGGAVATDGGAVVSAKNTIFWDNNARISGSDDLNGGLLLDHVVIKTGCPAGSICNAIVNTNPKLSSLGNHGGSTITALPSAGGSAIDAGDDAVCPPTDQRGISRPQGAHCDIGAVEWWPSDDIIFRNGFQ